MIDSTGVLELIGFIEERYEVQIADEEVLPENLDSIARITRFVGEKTPPAPMAPAEPLTAEALRLDRRGGDRRRDRRAPARGRLRRPAPPRRGRRPLRRRRLERRRALCARAFGPERVLGAAHARGASRPATRSTSRDVVAEPLGVETVLEDITELLEAAGCYERRDEAIRTVMPEYGRRLEGEDRPPEPARRRSRYSLFTVVAESPEGERREARLTADAYREVVAATNFKQRVRKMLEYYHADRLDYAVVGTPNRLEYDQGFFVKNGDGAADVKPIAHLYKTQVYQLAEQLGVPADDPRRGRRRPTPTRSQQSQEEFYFSVPFDKLDLCLYALQRGRLRPRPPRPQPASRRRSSSASTRTSSASAVPPQYLHAPPLLAGAVARPFEGARSGPPPPPKGWTPPGAGSFHEVSPRAFAHDERWAMV